MEAHAVTAHSKELELPEPWCPRERESRTIAARRRAGRSSWRTISSPVLAVAGQWIRRRSSPSR